MQTIYREHMRTSQMKIFLLFFIPQIESSFVFQTVRYLAREIVVVQVSAVVQRKCTRQRK
uniref:Uncharacterized protein n=1 Tax=Arundo donax TaxID=35708 RepID=A0A0A8Z027_ARUDO